MTSLAEANDEYPLSSDDSDMDDNFNEASFMSRMSSTTTENEEDDQGLDRIRMLMLNYYGNEGFNDEEEDEETKMNDIDGENFDVDVHLQNLLKTETLPNLLQRSMDLRKETRTLDSDMQNMVYENYSKFIRATDTIRTMKDDVTVIETELDKLMVGMEQLGETSGTLDTALEPNRSKIENMLSLQSLIKKLEFLFELPMRLKRSIELEAYVQAVKYYNTANAILEKYSHVLSFGSIHKESIEIMSGLKDLMYQKLLEGNQTASGMGDLTKLLLQMEVPKKELINVFTNWIKQKLQNSIDSIKKSRQFISDIYNKNVGNSKNNNETKRSTMLNSEKQKVWDMIDQFINVYCQFGNNFKDLFLVSDDKDDDDDNDETEKFLLKFTKEIFQAFFNEIKELFLDIPLPFDLLPDENAGLTPKFLEEVDEYDQQVDNNNEGDDENEKARNELLGLVSEENKTENPFFKDNTNDDAEDKTNNNNNNNNANGKADADETFSELINYIVRFRSSVRNAVMTVKSARLNDRLSEIIEKVVRSQITKVFESLQRTIILRAIAVNDELLKASKENNDDEDDDDNKKVSGKNPFLNNDNDDNNNPNNNDDMSTNNNPTNEHSNIIFLSTTLASVIGSDIEHALRKVKILLEQCSSKERLLPDMDILLVDLVQGQLKHTLKWVADAFVDFCDGVGPLKDSSPAIMTPLLLVNAVAVQDFSQNGVTRAASVLLECLPVGDDGFEGSMLNVGELMKLFADASKKLLSHFVLYKARTMSKDMRNSVINENWLSSREVTAVRPAIVDFIKDISNAGAQTSTVFGESSNKNLMGGGNGGGGMAVVGVSYGNDTMDNKGVAGAIDRIFSEKISIFGQIDFTTNSVLTGILKIVLKGLSESVRFQTFSKRGFQQIELDSNYIQNMLPSIIVHENDMLVSLIKDAMTSAGERCLNPEHLDRNKIIEILQPMISW